MTVFYAVLIAYALFCAFLCYSGPFVVVYWGPMAWLLRKIEMYAITFGRFCFKVSPSLPIGPKGIAHERRHTWQWRVLFVLFPPVYLVALAIQGYDGHFLENDARRAAGQPLR